jgi:DNA primase catalytic core
MSGNIVPHDRLLAAHTEAQRFYRQQLLTSAVAKGPCHYLAQRGLAHVLAADSVWQVGYAPARWTDLVTHLTHLGFAEEELLTAGLACRSRRGGVVDRFRDRVMLSQRNESGQVVGFIGRAAPGAPADVPKYLNSPQTPTYHKSQALFGLHEQQQAIANDYRLALVEGPLDVLAIAGIEATDQTAITAVAPCGTALTREHVERLVDWLPRGTDIVVAYDNDQPGRRATAEAYEVLTDCFDANSHALFAANMPRGTDPAELLQIHGPAALRAGLSGPSLTSLASHAIEVRLEAWERVLDGIDGRIAAVKDVAPLIRRLPRTHVADHIAKLALRVDLDPVTVTIAVTDALTEKTNRSHTTATRSQVLGPSVADEPPGAVQAEPLTL